MPITPKNIEIHELIGLQAKVVYAKNVKNVGIEGKIVDETQKTLTLQKNKKKSRIFKSQITLQIKLPSGETVEIEGKNLEGRPWERIKKK